MVVDIVSVRLDLIVVISVHQDVVVLEIVRNMNLLLEQPSVKVMRQGGICCGDEWDLWERLVVVQLMIERSEG